METVTKNPIKGKRFYLEIKNAAQIRQKITEYIVNFGGRIEEFLNAYVDYVVTNRPKEEWPDKSQTPKKPSHSSTTVASTINLVDSRSAAAGPQSSTPINMFNQKGAFSRASKMLQSTATSTSRPPGSVHAMDPLQMARNNNKKILHTQDLIDFIKKQQQQSPGGGGKRGGSSGTGGTTDRNSRRLQPPYIKLMDDSYRYKTNFKELLEWPEVNYHYQPELCPFYKPRRPSVVSANASQASHKSGVVVPECKLTDKFQTVLTTPILTNPTLLNLNVTTSNALKSLQSKTAAASKRKHLTFCEICHKDYEDFEKHLNDDAHHQFLNNNENFHDVVSVIDSLPKFLDNYHHHYPQHHPNVGRALNYSSRSSVGSNKSLTDISNVIPMFVDGQQQPSNNPHNQSSTQLSPSKLYHNQQSHHPNISPLQTSLNHNHNNNHLSYNNVNTSNSNVVGGNNHYHLHNVTANNTNATTNTITTTTNSQHNSPLNDGFANGMRKMASPLMHSIQLNNWDSKQCFMAIHELVHDDDGGDHPDEPQHLNENLPQML